MACSSTQAVQFSGLRERYEAAKTRVSNRLNQARETHPRLDEFSAKAENVRDEFRTRAEAAKSRLEQAVEKSTAEGGALNKAGDRASDLKAKAVEGWASLKERAQGLLSKEK